MHLRLLAACLLASAARAAQMDGLLKTDSPWAFLGKFCFNPSSKEYVRDQAREALLARVPCEFS